MVSVRGVQVTKFGPPEVLVPSRLPDPAAGRGQVVVEVSAADVIFLETQIRGGHWTEQFPIRPPYVPGGAIAGTVAATGADVDPSWTGRAVATRTVDGGGYAERAVAMETDLIPVPDGLARNTAAALLHDGPTALGLFDGAGVRPGEWVLVTGAAGAMGLLLVQLARAAGARVIAVARGTRKLATAAEAGAELTIDYSGQDWPRRVLDATGGRGADVVFDGVGGRLGTTAFGVTADGGRFSAHGAASGGFAEIDGEAAERRQVRVRGIEQVQFTPSRARQLAERALHEAAAGRITPTIGRTFPLERAADAHSAIEAREVAGKALVVP